MKRILILGFFLFVFLFSYPVYAFENGDFQYWNEEKIEAQFAEKYKIKFEEELRFGDNGGTLYYNHADIGLDYLVNNNIIFGVNYRQILKKIKTHWRPAYRPYLNGTLKLDLCGFILRDRNRFEFTLDHNADTLWTYRNKISLDFPLKWTRFNIAPYAAEELFYNFEKNQLTRNRVYMGLKMDFLKNLKGEIYYMVQSSKGKKWVNYNVLGTSLKVAF